MHSDIREDTNQLATTQKGVMPKNWPDCEEETVFEEIGRMMEEMAGAPREDTN